MKKKKHTGPLTKESKIFRVPKVWGEEQWIVNKSYCGKKLLLKKNYQCSLHSHKEKDETFYVQSGRVAMELGGEQYVLHPGDTVHVAPNTPHRFTGLEESEIFEFSTTHKDSDSYRLTQSGHIDTERFSRETEIIKRFPRSRVLVVGDVMLDTYLHGSVERLSVEAPVPVMRYEHDTHLPGGAANAARTARSLGGTVTLVGVVGRDKAASTLRALLVKDSIRPLLLIDPKRITTQKQRLAIKGFQQLARLDYEDTSALSPTQERRLITAVRKATTTADVMLLSDYAKGVFSPTVLQSCIAIAKKRGIPVVVGPKPTGHSYLAAVKGATLFVPNRAEAQVLGGNITSELLARRLAKNVQGNVLVTLGEKGMLLAENGKKLLHFPTLARSVVDITGAGDTVVATCALALAAGATLAEAADLANRAAGIVVGKPGTATLSADELRAVL
ncbi:MAG: PfkB family carbohydrate kinase [bacterium]|nr:PfkB family carbohydrate kinase [bacterium]